jgi:hypothetical protein
VEGLSLEALGGGGVIVAVIVGLILWRVLKLAIKVVVFLVVAIALAAGVAMYLQHGKVALPVDVAAPPG